MYVFRTVCTGDVVVFHAMFHAHGGGEAVIVPRICSTVGVYRLHYIVQKVLYIYSLCSTLCSTVFYIYLLKIKRESVIL